MTRVKIGVIQDLNPPLSPSSNSPPPKAKPAADLPPTVVNVHGQVVRLNTENADMAHRVIVDSFGGGDSGENKARLARLSAANLTADVDRLGYRFSRAWEGSAFDVISPSEDPDKSISIDRAFATQFFSTSANVATVQQQTVIMDTFDRHPPGGLVLEGSYDPGTLDSVIYDARYHAVILGMPTGARVVFLGVPAQDVESLCHAIAGDDAMRVAVSLDPSPRSYGALTSDSNLGLNMFVADHLLGAIAFGSLVTPPDLLANFRLAGGYAIKKPTDAFGPVAVMFKFSTGAYRDNGSSLEPSDNALDILWVPLIGSNGNFAAAMSTDVPQEFLDNGKHITGQLLYYRTEPIIALMVRYAQTATLLRGLKTEGVDLDELASGIAFANGSSK